MKRTAVILLNLGGPDGQMAVRPFLFNLFNDEAIIRLPKFFRFLTASLISRRREPVARAIYAKLGGGSPILKNTQAQAEALEKMLNTGEEIYKVFIAMRYWHPFAGQTAREVKKFAPDDIVLLPLYPQFSTTTTKSSFDDWHIAAQRNSLIAPVKKICCYPQQTGFIKALATATRKAYDEASAFGAPRVLFSAHGLPEKIIRDGDPYQYQCGLTVEALKRELNIENLDSTLCFQSRVGPLQWITPATNDEVRRAAADKKPLVVVPIAFTSDHAETLVELDIEYRELARLNGAPFYATVPAVGTAPDFIEGLALLVRAAQNQQKTCLSDKGAQLCPDNLLCPCTESR